MPVLDIYLYEISFKPIAKPIMTPIGKATNIVNNPSINIFTESEKQSGILIKAY